MFNLHPKLDQDCNVIGQFKLCLLLLMNDANYPWFILVPQKNGVSEVFQLSSNDFDQLSQESRHLARILHRVFKADKINIASLGNVVPQLHVHHIVRYKSDPVWPAPIWGGIPAKKYVSGEVSAVIEKLRGELGNEFSFSL